MKTSHDQRFTRHGSQRALFKLCPVATGCAVWLIASSSAFAQARYDATTGGFTVPARTALVYVVN
jgi:hypothetical protein